MTTWTHGTTTYRNDGRAFIAVSEQGHNLFLTRTPWGTGVLYGTFGSLAEAKRHAPQEL
jgi:hypothetical protein